MVKYLFVEENSWEMHVQVGSLGFAVGSLTGTFPCAIDSFEMTWKCESACFYGFGSFPLEAQPFAYLPSLSISGS